MTIQKLAPGHPGESAGLPRRPDAGRAALGEMRLRFRLNAADATKLRSLTDDGPEYIRALIREKFSKRKNRRAPIK